MIAVMIVVFFGLLALAVPVGHTLVIASGAAIWASDALPLMIIAQQMYNQTQSFPMLALPFFILAGSLMMSGRLGQNLIDFATALVQRFRGGLARLPLFVGGFGKIADFERHGMTDFCGFRWRIGAKWPCGADPPG